MKFGGSSVGSAEAAALVKKIVLAADDDTVVVVSALGGVTDGLLDVALAAHKGDRAYEATFAAIAARHTAMVDETALPERHPATMKATGALLEELGNILRGIYLIRDLSPKTRDTVVSYGERLSSAIIAGMIPGAELFDAREMIKTHPYYSKHVVDLALTEKLVREAFAARPRIAVMGGFIAADADTGEGTTLGRGGSDYTAAIVAAALDAEVLEIWTDVDGFRSADPRIIDNTYLIERLTFSEAMELCNFGAKVLFPSTIFPVYQKNIPIRVRNTFNAASPGTYISSDTEEE
jgi:aspartokinase/homoserine dehydrogenase 1